MFRYLTDNDNNAPIDEQAPLLGDDVLADNAAFEPLLDPIDGDDLDEVVIQVHPDDVEISAPLNPLKRKTLDQKLDECLDILNRAMADVETKKKSDRRKYYSLSTCILVGAAATSAIALWPIEMFRIAAEKWDEIARPYGEEFQALMPAYNMASEDLNVAKSHYQNTSKLLPNIPDKHSHDIYKYNYEFSINGKSCDSVFKDWLSSHPNITMPDLGKCHGPFAGFCDIDHLTHLYNLFQSNHPGFPSAEFCNPAVNGLCSYDRYYDEIGVNQNIAQACEDYYDAMNTWQPLDDAVKDVQRREAEAWSNFRGYNAAGDSAIVAPLLIFFGMMGGLAFFVYNNAKYKNHISESDEVLKAVTDPSELNKIISMAARLEFDLRGAKLADLRMACYAKKAELTALWKKRTAFLGGKIRKESSSYLGFFKYGESKDLKKIILAEAGLVPPVKLGG